MLEYDGTGFSGWAAQPGLRTVEGEVRTALDEVYESWRGLAVAGRTDAGVHALGQVASFEADGGPPPERAAQALNGVLPTTSPRSGAKRRPRDSARASRRRRAPTATASGAVASTRRSSGGARSGCRARWTRRHSSRRPRSCPARTTSARHPDRDPARVVRARRQRGKMAARRRHSQLHDHRRQLPAPHGSDPGRDDARTDPGEIERLLAGRPRDAAGRRRRHGACTWNGCTTRASIRSSRCATRTSSSTSTAP